jgi:hypothetical protein
LSCIFAEYSSTVNDTNYILCTSRCSEIVISFSNPSTLPQECQGNNDITPIHDYASVCGIDYRINYDNQEIYINFQASNHTGSLEDQTSSEFLVQTISLSLNTYSRQPNQVTRKYACNINNDCARNFYLNTINYLVNDGQSKLDFIKKKLHNESLLVGPESRRRCIDSNKKIDRPSRKCGSGFCYARLENFELNEQQNSKIQSCENYQEASLLSEIEHHIPKSTQKEREFLEYRCNKNVCNRNDIITIIQDAINQYTQWNPIQPENKQINEKAGNLSVKQAMFSYILVLFLTLIQLFI